MRKFFRGLLLLACSWGAVSVVLGENRDPQLRAALDGLGIVQGGYYDSEAESIVLLGDGMHPEASPSPEQVAVAFRWAFADEPGDPYVSIDPLPEDPEGPYMQIRIDDFSRDTSFGWVMFEADRLLKGYSLGRDSLSGVPVESRVQGYQSIFGWSDRFPGARSGTPVWSRFWFRPARTEVQSDETALRILDCAMGVETEIMFLRKGKLESSGGKRDKAADAFAEDFTKHYQAYAEEEPVFLALEQQCRLMLVSEWIRDLRERSLPVNLSWIAGLSAPTFPIPAFTPSLRVERTRKYEDGNATVTETAQLFGGVDLKVRPRRVASTAAFQTWKDSVKPSLPSQPRTKARFPVGGKTVVAVGFPGRAALPADAKPERLLSARLPGGEVQELALRPVETGRNVLADGSGRELALPVLRSYLPNGRRTAAGKTGFSKFTSVEGKPATKLEVREYELTSAEGERIAWFSEHAIDQVNETLFVKPRWEAEPGWILAPDPINSQAMWALKDGQRRWVFLMPGGELRAEWKGKTLLSYTYNRAGAVERVETTGGELVYAFEHSNGGARMAGVRTADGQYRDLRGAQRSEARSLPEELPMTVSLFGHNHKMTFRSGAEEKLEFLGELPGQGEVARLLGLHEHEIIRYQSTLKNDVLNVEVVEAEGSTLLLMGRHIEIVPDHVNGLRKAVATGRLGEGSAWNRAVEAVVAAVADRIVAITSLTFSAAADLGTLVAAQQSRKGGSALSLVVSENYPQARVNVQTLGADLRKWEREDVQLIVLPETIAEQGAAQQSLKKYVDNRELDVANALRSDTTGVVFLLYHSTANISEVLAAQAHLLRGKTVVCIACKAGSSAGNPSAKVAKVLRDAGAVSVVNASAFLHAEAAKRIMEAAESVPARSGSERDALEFIGEVIEEARKNVKPGSPQAEEILNSIDAMESALKKPTALRRMEAVPVG